MAPLQRRFRKSPWSSANPVDARLVDSRNCSIEISARAFETNQEIASFCQKWHSVSTHKRHTLRNRKILPASPWLPASFNAVRSFNPSKAERPSRKGSALFSGFAFSPVDRGSRAMSDESAGSGRRLAVRPHARAAKAGADLPFCRFQSAPTQLLQQPCAGLRQKKRETGNCLPVSRERFNGG